jgi:thymidylate kinase
MTERIIAFDGLDCIGKTAIINSLHDKLIKLDYIPYIFHLTSPTNDYNTFFTDYNFGYLNRRETNSIIQWSKFIQTFNMIKEILSESQRNIVILDRTPFSENIWNKFFHRENEYNNDRIFNTFLTLYNDILEKMLYINLDVESNILTNRIAEREIDKNNYIKFFNLTYESETDRQTDDISKIFQVVNIMKEEFNKLLIELRKFNVNIKTYSNNNLEDINFIVNNIINELSITIN